MVNLTITKTAFCLGAHTRVKEANVIEAAVLDASYADFKMLLSFSISTNLI